MSYFDRYAERILRGIRDEFIRTAMRRAISSYRRNTAAALERFPETLDHKKLVRKIKEDSIPRMEELVKKAKDAIEDQKGHAYIARTVKDALEILRDLIGSGKLVVKAKSLTMEEIDVNKHLEEWGNEVLETDLGEFLIQAAGEHPMHILSPAIHMPRERAAQLISKVVGKKLEPDIAKLVGAVRDFLRKKYFEADIGLTGANVVSADTGTIFLIENEGNARFVSNAPSVHICFAGFEKVVPTLMDAFLVSEVAWRYANYKVPAYVSLISAPSKTGDIEKVTTYGAHGPRELHVIFFDGGRTELAKDPLYREALYCLRCGGCLYECPIYAVVSGYFGYKYFAGVGAILTAFLEGGGGLEKAAPIAFTCTMCGRCTRHCPVEIRTADMVKKLREELISKGIYPGAFAEIVRQVKEKGNPYGEPPSSRSLESVLEKAEFG